MHNFVQTIHDLETDGLARMGAAVIHNQPQKFEKPLQDLRMELQVYQQGPLIADLQFEFAEYLRTNVKIKKSSLRKLWDSTTFQMTPLDSPAHFYVSGANSINVYAEQSYNLDFDQYRNAPQ